MTLTTTIAINYPVSPAALLDGVTRLAGGDPETVLRSACPDSCYSGCDHDPCAIRNQAMQGLSTLAGVRYSEGPLPRSEYDGNADDPPALVELYVDNPYGGGPGQTSGKAHQRDEILPGVREVLDGLGVPRDVWQWNNEYTGEWYPSSLNPLESSDD